MEGRRGTKKDWSEMSASRARSSRAEGERSVRSVGAWLRWAREERSSWPSDFTSSRVRAPALDFRFLVVLAAVADDDLAMAGGCAREAAARMGTRCGEVGNNRWLDAGSGVYRRRRLASWSHLSVWPTQEGHEPTSPNFVGTGPWMACLMMPREIRSAEYGDGYQAECGCV